MLDVSLKDYKKLVKNLEAINKDAEKAVTRTVSDFKSRGPGWVSKGIVEEYNVKKSEIKKAFSGSRKEGTIKLLGTQVDNIALIYKGRKLSPRQFNMTPKKPSTVKEKKERYIPGGNIEGFSGKIAKVHPLKAKAITAEIHKGKRRVQKGEEYNTPPFLQKGGNGEYIPFQRRGERRDDIVSLKPTSVPQMINNEKAEKYILRNIEEGIQKSLEHNVERILNSSK